ncbi:MAG TPA: tetratricopeptide repeat protein [Thermoanaerobaculia bacterium]|nr:tetratricopeptide repeat protein [Thermoanaerobaculia bacterium]
MEALAEAIIAAKKGEYLRALTLFGDFESAKSDPRFPEALSYYGLCLALVEKDYKSAIDLCRKAVDKQFFSPDNYSNLARVYLASGQRQKALETLDEGLKILPDDEVLTLLREDMGRRSRPPVPFLSRGNALNRALGRSRRVKKEPPLPPPPPLDEDV